MLISVMDCMMIVVIDENKERKKSKEVYVQASRSEQTECCRELG